MIKQFILLTIISLLALSCSKTGNLEKNLEELDEIYGKCDNPMRANEYNNHNKDSRLYRACKANENAKGTTLFDLGDSFKEAFNNQTSSNSGNLVYQNNVNSYLWRSALKLTKNYPLKIADNSGGYIETDWIYNDSSENNRCIIKIQITSPEIVSNGVDTVFICQIKSSENWVNDGINYKEEEKQLILKILSDASKTSNSQL